MAEAERADGDEGTVEGEWIPEARSEARAPSAKGRGRNPEFDTTLGARIRAARIAARMSQTALGAVLGVTHQQIQKYESGADRVSVGALQDVAAALSVDPGSFFGGDVLAPSGRIIDVRSAMRIAERIQRVRDPGVVRRLMALVDLLAGADDDGAKLPANGIGGGG